MAKSGKGQSDFNDQAIATYLYLHGFGNRRGQSYDGDIRMSVMRLPTGLSVRQAKKDAKKLSRKKLIKQSEALDLIAFDNGRASWSDLTHQIKSQSKVCARINSDFSADSVLELPSEKSITVVAGVTATGKSTLLRDLSVQWMGMKHPILYISRYESDWRNFADSHPTLFRYIDVDNAQSPSDFSDIYLNGSILMIDEFTSLKLDGQLEDIQTLINCSKHTVISTQSLQSAVEFIFSGALKNVSHDSCNFILMRGSQME